MEGENSKSSQLIRQNEARALAITFMDLGGQLHGSGDANTIPPKKPRRPSLHFILVKEWWVAPHSTREYIIWAILALIIGISVASFITQSVLLLKDYMDGISQAGTNTNIQNEQTTIPPHHAQTEHLGSDDAAGGFSTSTPLHQYRLANVDKFPKMSAQAYLIGDAETGEIIYEHNEELVSPMASVSKLMTAVIAKEKMNPDQVAIVSRDSYNTFGSEGELLLGEKIRISDLMYPLLIESSNDGAEVIADAFTAGHAKFLEELNKKAQSLGMTDTYYDDPSGLSPKNVSSIEDLFTLGRYIYAKHPEIWDITRVRQFAILNHHWTNANHQLQYDSFVGGKNGFIDEAKKTGVSIYDIDTAKGGKRNLVLVLLRSDDRDGDIAKLLTFVKKNVYYSPEVDDGSDTTDASTSQSTAQ